MRSAVLGFAAGVWGLQVQAALPEAWAICALALAALTLGAFARRAQRLIVKRAAWFASGTLLGFVWAALFAHCYLAAELPAAWEGRDVTIIGTIDSLPVRFEQGVRFNFAVERVMPIDGATPALPPKLALAWYAGFHEGDGQAAAEVRPGERWQLTVRLKRPHGNANPAGFDYEVWLLEQKLRATGYVRPDDRAELKNRRLDGFVFSFGNVVERCRAALRDRILDALPDKEYAGVLVALVIGDQRAVDQSDWKIFNRTGIGHLISISGLHITMIAGLFAALVSALWRRSFFTQTQLPLLLPAQKAAALAGAGVACLYVLLAGFGVPAQRTLYMLAVVAAALWWGRIASVSHVLCIALGVVLLLDPWAVLWPGFWLSFGAVAVILYASVGRTQSHAVPDSGNGRLTRWLNVFRSASRTQYAVTLGLVPLTMLLFGQISLVGPIANAAAIPLVGVLVTPLALAGSVLPAPLSVWALSFDHWLVEWLARFLSWLSEQPFAVWSAPVPPWWMFLPALLGALWLLAPRGWPLRWLGLVAWIPLAVSDSSRPNENEMWVTAFDVGQGMALLVETPRHRLLYDTGPYYSPESDGGSRVILPYLKARGIDALDAVLISHNDNDHSGGALSLFEELKVGWVASSLAADSKIVRAAPNHRPCLDGQSWEWDGVQFELLNPPQSSYESSKWKPNALSCVLKLTLGAQSILLTGDIEAVQEDELLGRAKDKLRANVLLAPHHGSGTSSTLPFLQAVRPEMALFQVGYRNRFRHPKAEVFERYGELGIRRLRNDEDGAITLRFGKSLEVETYRREHARYWYGR